MLKEKFWSNYFKVYDILNLSIPYKELLNDVINEIENKNGILLLDAGSGTGNLSIELKKLKIRVVSIDNSLSAIKIHKIKDPEANVKLHSLTSKLPFNDNSFDCIVCLLTLHVINVNERKGAIAEFFRILKSDGKLILANPYTNFSASRIFIEHIKKDFRKNGFFRLIKMFILLTIPTIKIFYYNFVIDKTSKKSGHGKLNIDEQKNLLKEAGFINLEPTKITYAKSVILDCGYKPRTLELKS